MGFIHHKESFILAVVSVLFSISILACSSNEPIMMDDGSIEYSGLHQNRVLVDYEDGPDCLDLSIRRQCERRVYKSVLSAIRNERRSYSRMNGCGIDLCWTEHVFVEPVEGSWGVTIRRAVAHTIPRHSGIDEERYSESAYIEQFDVKE